MSLLTRTADTAYALRFLRLLTTKWEDTGAFKVGLIDKNGKRLKKPQTAEEKDNYTIFHRLAFNLKRLINKVPGGKSTLASYAAAFFLLRESKEFNDTEMDEVEFELFRDLDLKESIESALSVGETYTLSEDAPLNKTMELLAKKGTSVVVTEKVGEELGVPVYRAYHEATKQLIFVTEGMVASGVTTGSVAVKPKPLAMVRRYKEFDVPTDVYRNFDYGRNKYERWKKFLNLEDDEQKKIYDYAKRNPGHIIVLRCSTTGALRSIRRRSTDF